jgi:hypothetical protein
MEMCFMLAKRFSLAGSRGPGELDFYGILKNPSFCLDFAL